MAAGSCALLDSPGSYGNCSQFPLLLSLPCLASGSPLVTGQGCGRTDLVSRADISICLPSSSDACKLHQDFISPLVQHSVLSGPWLAPVRPALKQVTNYIPATLAHLQVGA